MGRRRTATVDRGTLRPLRDGVACVAGARIEDYLVGVDGEVRTALWLEIVMLDQELRRGNREEPTLADYQESCPGGVVLLDPSTADLASVDELTPEGLEREQSVSLGLTRASGPLADSPSWSGPRSVATRPLSRWSPRRGCPAKRPTRWACPIPWDRSRGTWTSRPGPTAWPWRSRAAPWGTTCCSRSWARGAWGSSSRPGRRDSTGTSH